MTPQEDRFLSLSVFRDCRQCSTRFTGLYGLYPDNLEQDAHSKSLACHDCPLPLGPTCALEPKHVEELYAQC